MKTATLVLTISIAVIGLAGIAGFISGCEETPPLRTIQTNNPNYNVKLLFENDGCKVYRFLDPQSYEYVYYTDCRGIGSPVVSMEWNERRGKTYHQMQSLSNQ